ncbi:hypothetical protein BDN70DRAFT_989391 [Pholiota conissans]|uniref:Metaxin glutathione S-transferase domain-containing protein n=1 Tax=Pholiota conissans TaxID=109636 RepID=A0A9P5ZAX2_9AGAR|nr:hypothetical protein BDN70DRAFT_989391 [Pholiota conissans]
MASMLAVPAPLVRFNARFPLRTHPALVPASKRPLDAPTLWIAPPRASDTLLSADVECLKWQAFLALRGLTHIRLRTDIAPDGALGGALPNLHVPLSQSPLGDAGLANTDGADDGELLAAHAIPAWVDAHVGPAPAADDALEGYVDAAARIESRAWIALLEGVVHAALLISQPKPSYLHSLLFPKPSAPASESLQKLLLPPPAPLTGLLTFLPPAAVPSSGAIRVNTPAVLSSYRDAVSALSERLGTDKWFLGSSGPTPLDALAFAYLHCILHAPDSIRIDVTRRVNLVAWEWRVRCLVRDAFAP